MLGNDTLHVNILDRLVIHVLFRANEEIAQPTPGINLYDRMGNLIFAAGSAQIHHPLPMLRRGEELIVQFEIGFTVKPGEYTFSLIASEPSVDGGPNVGFFHDQYDMLGPISVVANGSQVFPFYGIAQLPLKISNSNPFAPG